MNIFIYLMHCKVLIGADSVKLWLLAVSFNFCIALVVGYYYIIINIGYVLARVGVCVRVCVIGLNFTN